jgi:hypothetical protein
MAFHCLEKSYQLMLDYSNIIVLILSTKDSEFDSFRAAIESTWLQDFKNVGIKCFFYEGGSDANKIDGDYIKLKCPDDLYNVSRKLIEALKIVFEKYPEVKLVYRTNLSSYIDVETFLKFIQVNKFTEDTYAGVIGNSYIFRELLYKYKLLYYVSRFIIFGRRVQFASGAGFFLGANHCRTIIFSKNNLNLVDDIMVANTINVSPLITAIPERLTVSIESRRHFQKKEFLNLVYEKYLFHYRFKTKNRNEDAFLLKMFGEKKFRESFFICQND